MLPDQRAKELRRVHGTARLAAALSADGQIVTQVLVAALVLATPAAAEQVCEIGIDWTGNDIVIEAIADPKVKGITCHLADFSRGMIDRLRPGNWFEDRSNSSIACRQTGPMVIDTIETGEDRRRSSASARA